MPPRIIRASEIGQFAFCQRAWWYAQQGEPSLNMEWMDAGSQVHRQYSRRVGSVGCLRRAGYALVLAAAVLAAVALILRPGG
ncbi:MAG: hypothetical protein AB1449_04085 [Chloroflexota bacterium]